MHDEIEGVGHRFVQVLTDDLWYIDGQYHSRCKHAKVPLIPNMFLKFNKGGGGGEIIKVSIMTGRQRKGNPLS